MIESRNQERNRSDFYEQEVKNTVSSCRTPTHLSNSGLSISCHLLNQIVFTPRRQMFEELEQKTVLLKNKNVVLEDEISQTYKHITSSCSMSSEEQIDDFQRIREVCNIRLQNSKDCMSELNYRKLKKITQYSAECPEKLSDIFQGKLKEIKDSFCSNCCSSNLTKKLIKPCSNSYSNSLGSSDYITNNSTSDVSYYVTSHPSRSGTFSMYSSTKCKKKSYLIPSNSLALRYQKKKLD